MNRRQKLVQQEFLNNEKAVIDRLRYIYDQSLFEVNSKIRGLEFQIGDLTEEYDWLEDDDPQKEIIRSRIQSKIYQKQYQEALQGQLDDILKKMQTKQFLTVSDYLDECYTDGFVGTVFDQHGQGVPLTLPIDQEAMVRAVQLDSKISQGLYTRLGEDVGVLKKRITSEVTRSIATGASYAQVAKRLSNQTKIGFNRAVRIARTEGHRIQCTAAMDAMVAAKDRGADVLKQWDATLDDVTRESHRQVDGEIRELDKPFSNKLMYAGDPAGGAAEVINCRCAVLQRARWALDEDELQTLKDRAAYFGLDKSEEFDDFKKKYLKAVEEPPVVVQKPTFVPAKTVKEAEEYAKKFAESISYKGITLENCNAINEQLDHLMYKYPCKKYAKISQRRMKATASANYESLTINGQKIGVSEKNENFTLVQGMDRITLKMLREKYPNRVPPDVQKQIDKLERNLKFVRWNVSHDHGLKATIAHEFGHTLSDQYFGMINDTMANSNAHSLECRAARQLISEARQRAWDTGDIFTISKYGATDDDEFFAEAFAMREVGEALPDYISNMLSEVLKNGIM